MLSKKTHTNLFIYYDSDTTEENMPGLYQWIITYTCKPNVKALNIMLKHYVNLMARFQI